MKDRETEDERLANESWLSEDSGYRIMTSESTYIHAFKKGLKVGRRGGKQEAELSAEIEVLERELQAEKNMRQYWHDEYCKVVSKK